MSQKQELRDFSEKFVVAPIPRPHLTAHHSSSLPSTPYHKPRQLSFGARSPSPERVIKDGSPKSNHSEPDKRTRSGSKAPPLSGCKYETGMAYSRRRIPYSIGGDLLERAKTPPKKFLNPIEEEKLSGDMRELYDRILPSAESDKRRSDFVKKLDRILNEQWPGNDIKVHVFGSSGNMLCTSDSDVDICITTPMKALERVCLLANALAEHGMKRVVCVPHAKVPIVKFWDPELKLACDMNVNNTLALENTRMLKTYVEIDERVRPLAMIIKQWTKRRILNDAALGGTLSSYTWICLILNFLQTRNPPILPSLHKKPHLRRLDADGKPSGFDDDIDKLRGYGYRNTETLGDLLFHFFRRYAYDFDYEKNVVSVREGKLISKEGKKWHLMANNRLCVEEPFNTERNLGNTADDTSFRGIHLELRRAFELIKDAKLDECLEEYVFPATEEKVWEKPTPKPPPVLTRSRSQSQSQTSQSKRGGHNSRGGRHGPGGNRGHANHQPRRASSAAAQSKFPGPPLVFGNAAREYLARENPLQAQLDQIKLHNELFTRYQMLQAQEEELRRIQAASQLQILQRSHDDASLPHQPTKDTPHRLPINQYVPLTAPSRSAHFFQPYNYPQVPGTPQQSVHTQPSSPSLRHAQPELRRSAQRSSAADGLPSSNNRSHSQPARALPLSLATQNAPPLPLNSHAWLQHQHQLRQQQIAEALEMSQQRYRPIDVPFYPDPRRHGMDHFYEESVPKEYVGYWVNDSPPAKQYGEEPTLHRVPAYHDLHPRVRGVPPSFSRLKNGSRSPSPSRSLPFRDRSFSMRSASSAPSQPIQSQYARLATAMQGSRVSGSLVASGPDGWPTPHYPMSAEGSSHATTISEATSGSDDRMQETPATADTDASTSHVFDDGFGLDDRYPYFYQPAVVDPTGITYRQGNGNHDQIIRPTNHQRDEKVSSSASSQRTEKPSSSSGGLGIQFGEHQFNRPSGKPDPVPPPEKSRPVVQTSQPESKSSPTATRAEAIPLPVPLLSPVREVTTPSPTAKRHDAIVPDPQRSSIKRPSGKLDLYIPSFAEITRLKHEKRQSSALNQKPNGILTAPNLSPPQSNKSIAQGPQAKHFPGETPLSPKVPVQSAQVNGWQTQPSKKNKKNRSRPSSGQIVPGDSLPANEAERKGG